MLFILTILVLGLPLYLLAETIYRRRLKRRRAAESSAASGPEPGVADAQATRKDRPPRTQPRWRVWSRAILAAALLIVAAHQAILLTKIFRMRDSDPATTSFIDWRIAQAQARAVEPKREQVWVKYNQISSNLARAVVVGEDWRFCSHWGLDWFAIIGAIERNWDQERFEKGASTISQQLAKNLFLSTSKNPVRKLYEALITYELEAILGKRRILEIYLNVVEWGDGIYGAEAAARHYFHKPAAALDREQAAFLGAILPSPLETFNPDKYGDRVRSRSAWIVSMMDYVTVPE